MTNLFLSFYVRRNDLLCELCNGSIINIIHVVELLDRKFKLNYHILVFVVPAIIQSVISSE